MKLSTSALLLGLLLSIPAQAGTLFPPENDGKPADQPCPNGYALIWTGSSVACAPNAVPTGAVMAFNLAACPTGWSALPGVAGRAIIGAGVGAGLTPRSLGETGGEEKHVLTTAEMPAHKHGTDWQEYNENGAGSVPVMASGNSNSPEWYHFTSPTLEAGEGKAHANMQPYIALLYCQKN